MGDVISETIGTVVALIRDGKLELQEAAHRAESEVRASWGGERVYIGKTSVDTLRAMTQRDRAIQRDWARGDHIPVLARRYGISPRRVQQLVAVDTDRRETSCLTDFAASVDSANHDPVRDPTGQADRRRRPQQNR